jgi:hypothetical protein
VARKKGEVVTLYCTHCTWSTELALAAMQDSQVIACVHCSSPIYWHVCPTCGLKFVGQEAPHCPICDGDASLEDVSFD